MNHYTFHVRGPKDRLIYDKNQPINLSNTLFNTRSGYIKLEKHVMISSNCMLLTGTHNYNGALEDLKELYKVPNDGRDIIIGEATWIASGCIVLGGGNNW